ncbi:MAG TPA: hypothetical protein VFB25_00950 [Gaiellaceae bacterium]|nr:hypothetical protein [Gaiellaceae bacterium]
MSWTALSGPLVFCGALLVAAATSHRTAARQSVVDAAVFLVFTAGGIAALGFALLLLMLRFGL